MHNWFKSYLSERKQYTVVNKIKSKFHKVLCCFLSCPLQYVNDIGNISKNINDKIMLFADDTKAFTVNKDLNQLKYDGEKLL